MKEKDCIFNYKLLRKTIEKAKTGTKFRQQMESALKKGFPIDFVPTPDAYSQRSTSLLEWAIIRQKDEIVNYLLNLGADADIITNVFYLAPLSFACKNDLMPDTIKLLAEKTKNINVSNKIGHTALGLLCKSYIKTYIAFCNSLSLEEKLENIFLKIRILLEYGADPEIDNSWKEPQQYNCVEQNYRYLPVLDSVDDVLLIINDLESRISAYMETKSEMQSSSGIGYEYEI